MSSLKMTFSLASLVLLMAFVAMPVMAHTVAGVDDHGADDAAHAVVKSITVPSKYTDGTSFDVKVVFEAANTAKKIILPTEALTDNDISVEGGNVTLIAPLPGTAKSTQSFSVVSASDTTISINGTYAYSPAVPATGADKFRPVVVHDSTDPMLTVDVDTEAGFTLVSGTTDKLMGAFTILVGIPRESLVEDNSIAAPISKVVVSVLPAGKATLTPTSGVATFGNPYFGAAPPALYVAEYRVMVTPAVGFDGTLTISAVVTDAAGNVGRSDAASENSFAVVPAVGTKAAVITPDVDIPGTTVVTLSGKIGSNKFMTVDSGIPNLELFFSRGGTITLSDAGAAKTDHAAKTVVISEILWGLDYAQKIADGGQLQWQFVELYNTNIEDITADKDAGEIDLKDWTLTFTIGRPLPANDVDQVSNISGAGWIVDIGQSGRVTDPTVAGTALPINIVSMYRKINYKKVQNTDGGDAAKRLDGVPGGNAKGSWAASTRATRFVGVIDSLGSEHFRGISVFTQTNVPRSPFVINELGNQTGGTNDWVELRNVTDAEKSLKNYQLSVVTGDPADPSTKKDTQLFHFKDNDYKVPAGGVIVVTSSSPKETDLAAGKDVSIADDQEENEGASHLFVVRSFDLPDSGKNLLILRNNHEGGKLGTTNNIIDVIGTLSIPVNEAGFNTSLWPLAVTGKAHGNVIDGTGDEDFRAGKVYQRNNAGGGTGEKHIAVRGYTGIGYDRAAAKSGANGGTPGYDNGALKEKVADLSDAEITISEIMVDTGEGRQNLPQWIELYNSSMTQAVNTNGWKLAIENLNDVETAFNATLTLGAMTISPNQTILIATTSGSRSDPDHFPSTRVVNLWTTKAHRDELEMVRRTDQAFSTTGFHFKLTDKDNKLVDEAGNLDGNRRTQDEPAWALPVGEKDGRRSSLIRVYDTGIGVKGTLAAAWVSADATNLAFAISQTYFGDPDDFGTPGFRAGGPLPVSLSKFRPERLDSGEIVVRWITESETNNAGFNILRSEKRDGEFTKLNTKLIAGQGTTSERTVYKFADTSAKPNVVYYYQIQDVSLDGQVTPLAITHLRGNVTAAGKLTTTWAELKALQ